MLIKYPAKARAEAVTLFLPEAIKGLLGSTPWLLNTYKS